MLIKVNEGVSVIPSLIVESRDDAGNVTAFICKMGVTLVKFDNNSYLASYETISLTSIGKHKFYPRNRFNIKDSINGTFLASVAIRQNTVQRVRRATYAYSFSHDL